MKEKLFTIPVNDAINADDECMFCYIERDIEQKLLDFTLGSSSSYMESDIRDKTDAAGFCKEHYKKMFRYGNALGNAWIMKTHVKKMTGEMLSAMDAYKPSKISLKAKLTGKTDAVNEITRWVNTKKNTCFICEGFRDDYERYMDTFFYLYKNDESFAYRIKNGKGFCIPHFGDLADAAQTRLGDKEKQEFFEVLFDRMKVAMERISEDLSWNIEKFDYRNADADWKNSRDAVPRSMQKMGGGYPGDKDYISKK